VSAASVKRPNLASDRSTQPASGTNSPVPVPMPVSELGSAFSRAVERVNTASERELFEMVYRSMRSLAGPHAPDLDDLVQSAAEQVMKSLPAFDRRSELRTWVYAVSYRVLLRQRRWYRRWAARFSLGVEQHEMESEAPLPSELLEAREQARELRELLAGLSEKCRAVLILHDIEERSIAEIAGIVGSGELTVRSRLRDGRKHLAKLLRARTAREWMET
jgi:RNA polymerase sigma-70 factor, ECF subfamily